KKMYYYSAAGIAHQLIFGGFVVLLLRSLMLWGRGFDPSFNLWILGPTPVHLPLIGAVPLGNIYAFLKDVTASLVIVGALVFVYYRVVKHEARMTLSGEGVLILGIILAMMFSDMLYDGASMVLHHRFAGVTCGGADATRGLGTLASQDVCQRVQTITAH